MKSVKASFRAFQGDSNGPQKTPHWTFIRNRNVRGDKADKPFGVGGFSSPNCGTGRVTEQDPFRCDAEKWEAVLNARLGHTMACLQVCLQQIADRKMYMPKTLGRVLVISNDCPRQKLHSESKSAPRVRKKEDGPEGGEDEN